MLSPTRMRKAAAALHLEMEGSSTLGSLTVKELCSHLKDKVDAESVERLMGMALAS